MQQPNPAGHVFDHAIALAATGEGHYAGRTSAAYGNMVGPFGGVIGATLLNAVLAHPARLGDPLSMTVHYTAPIADGEFTLQARTMRTNRSTQHWLVELLQHGQVAAYASAVTALRRDTWGTTDAVFPQVPAAAGLEAAPALQRVAWTGCYDMRFVDGGPQDSQGLSSQTRVWMRDEPPRPLDFLSLTALCDAFFPRIFLRRPKWVPIGTVALTTYFHADAAALREVGSAAVLGAARALHFGNGFFDQSAEVWSAEGRLLAATHQVVYYKE